MKMSLNKNKNKWKFILKVVYKLFDWKYNLRKVKI